MARTSRNARATEESQVATNPSGNANGKGGRRGSGGDSESNSSYFRKLYRENRKFLKIRSNAEVLERWLIDHPGETEVPDTVKQSLANVKSDMRHKLRKHKAPPVPSVEAPPETMESITAAPESELEGLEIQIDDCLTLAKNIDRDMLQDAITLLRRARNEVVLKGGQ